MANKASFSSEEWKKIMQGVMMAGIAVSAAEPSGLWGTLKESLASGRAMFDAKTETTDSPEANKLLGREYRKGFELPAV